MKSRRFATFNLACLRAGSERLCLALILGLLLVPAYVVTPLLFGMLSERALAGEIAGRLFHISYTAVLLLAVAVAAFWRGRRAGRLAWLLLAALLLLVAANAFGVAAILADIKAAAGPVTALAEDHPARLRFAMWHGISAGLHLLSSLLAVLLVAMAPMEKPCTR